ncbi:MAG: helix-turn-helix transcriptional regulator [Lachnospiraceae bacterium]|jgi:transcriptional regulator with XRE-family HTH domain|nr:helix-turn-helix transcriptional regulator [Lachnospiraceae bacterium]RKI85191.1 XRE family transcriptional regulator [bacterium 1xD42-87]
MPKHEREYKMIGLNVAYYRKLNGISQLQLAEKIGVSRTHVSNIEAPNMPTAVSLETLLEIADALKIPAKSLLDFRE